jgi:hypothetical protein
MGTALPPASTTLTFDRFICDVPPDVLAVKVIRAKIPGEEAVQLPRMAHAIPVIVPAVLFGVTGMKNVVQLLDSKFPSVTLFALNSEGSKLTSA